MAVPADRKITAASARSVNISVTHFLMSGAAVVLGVRVAVEDAYLSGQQRGVSIGTGCSLGARTRGAPNGCDPEAVELTSTTRSKQVSLTNGRREYHGSVLDVARSMKSSVTWAPSDHKAHIGKVPIVNHMVGSPYST